MDLLYVFFRMFPYEFFCQKKPKIDIFKKEKIEFFENLIRESCIFKKYCFRVLQCLPMKFDPKIVYFLENTKVCRIYLGVPLIIFTRSFNSII